MATKKSAPAKDSKAKAPAKKVSGASASSAKKRMTQTEIINNLADSSGLKKNQVKDLMNNLATLATNEVQLNSEFTLPGFGKLVLTQRKAREGRNPATGAAIKIPEKTTLKFRLGKSMKDAVGGSSSKK